MAHLLNRGGEELSFFFHSLASLVAVVLLFEAPGLFDLATLLLVHVGIGEKDACLAAMFDLMPIVDEVMKIGNRCVERLGVDD